MIVNFRMPAPITHTESRKGISLSEEELAYLDSVVSPGIKNGQAVSVVWNTHKEEMPVSDRTLYTYINSGLLDADNFDLRRKLRMPSRKKSGPVLRVDKQCHIGRSYEDYEAFIFWGIIKREMYYGRKFKSKEELICSIKDYMDYYINQRVQRKLGVLTPIEFHRKKVAQAA